jgi:hypothetical protein
MIDWNTEIKNPLPGPKACVCSIGEQVRYNPFCQILVGYFWLDTNDSCGHV